MSSSTSTAMLLKACVAVIMAITAHRAAVSAQSYSDGSLPKTFDQPGCRTSENDPDADCIFGVAGHDYPTYHSVPSTVFSCDGHLPGIYADPDSACQVYHMCLAGGSVHSFLCPNGTLFHQEYFICDLWFNVDCSRATKFYSLNENIYKDPETKETDISYV
ncbi:unnamed protein product [Meganyctiphanes norvegica]|uniref:Chitin-binding type-2 domain-containing protein n=1 Tax=Meganyctiphanes norvegica TaxID=48144 RepID=A0AAV2QL47_MEGNR